MQRLTIKKLELILNDFKENQVEFIDNDQMIKIYELYGDKAYYNRDTSNMDVVEKGRVYIKLRGR